MKYLIYLFIILSIMTIGCKNTVQYATGFADLKKEIYKTAPVIDASDPSTYASDCKLEDQKKITFPMAKPAYAILYKDKLFSLTRKLSSSNLNTLIKLMNDTANYKWGEIGTPDFDRYVVIYASNNKCIGLLHISYDGTVHADPFIKKMKWGMVDEKTLNKIKEICR